MRLALRILRPHSLTLTVSLCLTVSLSHCLTVSLSHCLSLSLISLISLISFSSLSSLSPLSLSLSPLCLSSFRLSSLSSLAGGSGQRATYKGLFTPASKKSAVFFPTSLPSTFPFWSASFRTPPWPQVLFLNLIVSTSFLLLLGRHLLLLAWHLLLVSQIHRAIS